MASNPSAERLSRRLKALQLNASTAQKVVAVGAMPIENKAKELARVRTGTMRRDIHTKTEALGDGAKALIGNSSAVPYAIFQELGTATISANAYLRGGLRMAASDAIRDMGRAVAGLLR